MSYKSIKEEFASHRIQEFSGKGDQYLSEVAVELGKRLAKILEMFEDTPLYLSEPQLDVLTSIVVDFAEDIHNDIGLWRSLEYYNKKFFGVPLPLTASQKNIKKGLHPLRIQHLLWKTLCFLEPRLILHPRFSALEVSAYELALFLQEEFQKIPQDSGIKKFLSQPNEYGWDIKRKLIWLGTHSYLFRLAFVHYAYKNASYSRIGMIDDFLCQECTIWSGLGAIDILAQTLDLKRNERTTLQGWYERHTAFYKILSIENNADKTQTITALNLINNQPYSIMIDMQNCPFRCNDVVFGSLTAWRDKWYWSGEQKSYGKVSEEDIKKMRKAFLEMSTTICYRYCPDLAKRVTEYVHSQHEEFMAHYGKDLVVYPNGRAVAREMQNVLKSKFEKHPAEDIEKIMKLNNLAKPEPMLDFGEDFMQCDKEVGVFSNPEQGQELMLYFDTLIQGLKKKGSKITYDEAHVIRGFMQSPAISPAFVHRVVQEYGAESIGEAYMIENIPGEKVVEYFLRCYKGHFYRRLFPAFNFLQ